MNTIDIQAVVNKDGSMHVTQTWDGRFEEGTENYIPMNAPDYLTISELKVSDQNGAYETVPNWNVDWSFKDKARKCGINSTSDGYEICFGISEYGQNRYTLDYKLDNVVGGYTDRDGVNFRFVNDQMNTTPTDVTVQIRLADGTPITDDIADIWAFGYSGEVVFENGAIIAHTQDPINTNNHVTIMFAFDKGVLTPSRQESGSFEEVRQRAFEGSDYDEPEGEGEEVPAFLAMIITALSIAFPIGVILLFIKLQKKSVLNKRKKLQSQFEYFRDIPNEGNTNATYALGRFFDVCEDGAILATSMLRLIDLGCLSPVTEQEVGFMGKTKEVVNLQLSGTQNSAMNEYDEYLYTVLESAAGSDRILQAKELERFASQNDKLLRNYINKCDSAGRAYLGQKHCFKRWDLPSRLAYLTPTGVKELGELIGFKKYLEDFSLIAERGVKEIPIWRELLSYAMLFGIADKVAEQIKALYPAISSEVTAYNRSLYTAYSYHYLLYRNMKQAEIQRIQQKRSSGGGGFASFGGGGGSIGGGSGGGSR
ncbi:MAG: DUF2207 domain-containing protein [Candidatus Fimivivens sp.]|nr:DUF2207 domain-containing protein [Candidatus Fimivivens sp.]